MRQKIGCLAIAALALAGTVAHAEAPPESGTISVEPMAIPPELRSSMPAFVDAVGKALAARRFTWLEGVGHARLVADLSLTRADAGIGTTKVPVAGPKPVAGGIVAMVGGSVDFSLPTSKSKNQSLLQTRLEISIRKQGEKDAIWHGAATTVRASDAANGADDAVARDLAEAILRDYPTQSESVASVP